MFSAQADLPNINIGCELPGGRTIGCEDGCSISFKVKYHEDHMKKREKILQYFAKLIKTIGVVVD